MKPYYQSDSATVYCADVLEALREMPDESVHCCVTSPPYWGLRSYLDDDHPDKGLEIGLEATLQDYIAKMVEVFAEVRRLLRTDGTLWLNMGSSFSSGCSSNQSDRSHGIFGKQSSDYQDDDCGWSHLYDEHPDCWSNHTAYIESHRALLLTDDAHDQSPERMERICLCLDSLGSALRRQNKRLNHATLDLLHFPGPFDERLRAFLLSTICEFWQLSPGDNLRADTLRAFSCQPTPRSSFFDALLSAYTAGRIDDIAQLLHFWESCNLGKDSFALAYPHSTTMYFNFKPKDLINTPFFLAEALRSDGWYLRSDIIWAKPNPMPESVTDRPTKAHEYVFLLTKAPRYFYDAEAIREPLSDASVKRISQPNFNGQTGGPKDYGKESNRSARKTLENFAAKNRGHARPHEGFNDRWDQMTKKEQGSGGANKRDVWTIATQPYSEAHFATFPERLVEPCVKAGCPAAGTVLDPFGGSLTSGVVALKLRRRFIGIELNQQYLDDFGLDRLRAAEQGLTVKEVRSGQQGLFNGGGTK